MAKFFDNLSNDCFKILKGFGYRLTLYDSSGNKIYEPKVARCMFAEPTKFLLSINELGSDSSISLAISKDTNITDIKKLIETLRNICTRNNVLFNVRKYGKILSPKDFSKTMKSVDESLTESMWGSSRTSYQKIGNCKVIIKHSSNVNEQLIGSRGKNIHKIFLETNEGERLRFPVNYLLGARVWAKHLSNNGSPNDNVSSYIISLSEELQNLRITSKSINKIIELNEDLKEFIPDLYERILEIKNMFKNAYKTNDFKNFMDNVNIISDLHLNENSEKMFTYFKIDQQFDLANNVTPFLQLIRNKMSNLINSPFKITFKNQDRISDLVESLKGEFGYRKNRDFMVENNSVIMTEHAFLDAMKYTNHAYPNLVMHEDISNDMNVDISYKKEGGHTTDAFIARFSYDGCEYKIRFDTEKYKEGPVSIQVIGIEYKNSDPANYFNEDACNIIINEIDKYIKKIKPDQFQFLIIGANSPVLKIKHKLIDKFRSSYTFKFDNTRKNLPLTPHSVLIFTKHNASNLDEDISNDKIYVVCDPDMELVFWKCDSTDTANKFSQLLLSLKDNGYYDYDIRFVRAVNEEFFINKEDIPTKTITSSMLAKLESLDNEKFFRWYNTQNYSTTANADSYHEYQDRLDGTLNEDTIYEDSPEDKVYQYAKTWVTKRRQLVGEPIVGKDFDEYVSQLADGFKELIAGTLDVNPISSKVSRFTNPQSELAHKIGRVLDPKAKLTNDSLWNYLSNISDKLSHNLKLTTNETFFANKVADIVDSSTTTSENREYFPEMEQVETWFKQFEPNKMFAKQNKVKEDSFESPYNLEPSEEQEAIWYDEMIDKTEEVLEDPDFFDIRSTPSSDNEDFISDVFGRVLNSFEDAQQEYIYNNRDEIVSFIKEYLSLNSNDIIPETDVTIGDDYSDDFINDVKYKTDEEIINDDLLKIKRLAGI